MTGNGVGAGGDGAPDAAGRVVGERRERATLPVVPPAIPRAEVESSGRVGAVAYPFRVYEARVELERPLLSAREDRFVAGVDRSRRLVVRADTLPDVEERTVADALVLPSELSDEQAREKAREAVFRWTLRRYSPARAPEIAFERTVDAYRLFWIAQRPDGDAVVDSVRGTESPLVE